MRYRSLDLLRGLGVLLMVFLHAALYQFGGLMEMDMSRPPLVATVIGFLLMWGGLFAVLSGATHAIQSVTRIRSGIPARTVMKWELQSGAGFVALGVIYFVLLGPTMIDLAAGARDYSVLVSLIRTGSAELPSLGRVLYMHTLFMVGFNTLLVAPLFAWLAVRCDPHSRRFLAGTAIAAAGILLFSWLRIPLYPLFEQAVRGESSPLMLALFWLVNKNDPMLPSLGLALLGTTAGLIMTSEHAGLRRALAIGFGAALVMAGIAGWVFGPQTMLRRSIDWTWYAITLVQAGVMLAGVLLIHARLDADRSGGTPPGVVERVLFRFSQASLSVLFAETLLAECAARVLGLLEPGWNRTLVAALVFAVAATIAWSLTLSAWSRRGFCCSLERAWVRSMNRLGRPSTKLAMLAS
jgi:hypothetical protein